MSRPPDATRERPDRRALAPALRLSRSGLIAAGLFSLAALGVFARVLLSASRNPADSGESGILLLPFAMPWVMWLPGSWLGPQAGLGCIALNALILYAAFGGLRLRR